MSSVVEQFADSPLFNEIERVSGTASATQFSDRPCLMVRFKATASNAGSFFLGNYSNKCYWELDAGDDTGWVSANNLNKFWYLNSSGTTDTLAYWLQK